MPTPLRAVLIICFITLSLALVACARTAPVNNVSAAPVNAEVSQQDVRRAIIRAGSRRGWRMREEGSGHLVGRLELRDHVAEVDIFYDADSYDIEYRSSEELNYDPDAGTIHSNYNGWIQNLDRDIQNEILAI